MVDLNGLNPAHLLPLTEDEEIDEETLYSHFQTISEVEGVTGIACNAHASEVATLTEEEKERVIQLAGDAVGEETTIISGVVSNGTEAAIGEAQRRNDTGADAILLFPPAAREPEEIIQFHEEVASAIEIPIVAFQHPERSGVRYNRETLKGVASVTGVEAVKNATWVVDEFEDDTRAIRQAAPDVTILIGNDEYLLPCYSFGEVDGGLLGLGGVIPEAIIDLFNSVDENDIRTAQEIYNRIDPVVDALYGQESGIRGGAHAKCKVALELQGEFPNSIPRRPSLPVPEKDIETIRDRMRRAELLG